MNIEILIPNYNGIKLLRKNIPKLFDVINEHPEISITIIDDCSAPLEIKALEELVDELKKRGKKINLLKNEKNLGFSSTVNKGAFASSAKILILLNSDVVPEKGFMEHAMQHFSDPDVFGVGCMDKSVEKNEIVLRGRGMGLWKRGFVMHQRGEVDKSDTFWISGGSSFVRRDVFVELGGFDTIYNPFFWEDIDLSYRAKKSGWKLIFEKRSVVEHRHMEGAIKTHFTSFRIKTISYRNQFIFVWKNITDLNLILNHLLYLPYHLARALIAGDLALIYGIFLALVKFPAIIIKRHSQKRKYVMSDSKILFP